MGGMVARRVAQPSTDFMHHILMSMHCQCRVNPNKGCLGALCSCVRALTLPVPLRPTRPYLHARTQGGGSGGRVQGAGRDAAPIQLPATNA